MDVIHVNLGARGGCYRKMALIAIPRLMGTPYVLHLHGSAFEAFWRDAPAFVRRRIDHLFRQAAQVIVLGEVWRRLVIRHLPDAADRIIVLPNATPALLKKPKTTIATGVRLLFLGELGARKGSPVLIEALARLETQTRWTAVLAGDGEIMAARQAVERQGLSCHVSVPGWVGPGDVEALLTNSDILVLPSLEENLPMSVIEAFAAGLAVVATPVGALPDILQHGKTGMMTPPGDVQTLAAVLSALIDDANLRCRLGAAARAYHAEHLSLDPYAFRLANLWKAAAERTANLSYDAYCVPCTF